MTWGFTDGVLKVYQPTRPTHCVRSQVKLGSDTPSHPPRLAEEGERFYKLRAESPLYYWVEDFMGASYTIRKTGEEDQLMTLDAEKRVWITLPPCVTPQDVTTGEESCKSLSRKVTSTSNSYNCSTSPPTPVTIRGEATDGGALSSDEGGKIL
eukprot:TRINITY_DN178515_c0_g1_i1.p1 TRINITY_DN178515_c0_g1~~TRINITY_DN178515_c0_g1_i1.p1  ORF type:complete len:153 (-),score=8.75 TRINITY_DN178515_c0_g1_i1:132-590(-)